MCSGGIKYKAPRGFMQTAVQSWRHKLSRFLGNILQIFLYMCVVVIAIKSMLFQGYIHIYNCDPIYFDFSTAQLLFTPSFTYILILLFFRYGTSISPMTCKMQYIQFSADGMKTTFDVFLSISLLLLFSYYFFFF